MINSYYVSSSIDSNSFAVLKKYLTRSIHNQFYLVFHYCLAFQKHLEMFGLIQDVLHGSVPLI